MTVKKFFENNPQVAPIAVLTDEQLEILSQIDLGRLSHAIKKSGFLRSRHSFNWLIRNYDNILAGAYGDWERYVAPKRKSKSERRAGRTKTERHYSKKECAALVSDIETVEF